MRFLVAILITVVSLHAHAKDKPNILWITAEDMSATLGCYGDEYANTPNIDKLATESVRYTHAFATAPVCSPSRSCLITGCYATSLGTQQMRSAFPIPESMTGFPSILREQLGYYTSNNVKTDYNTANWEKIIAGSWNESSAEAHWRNRSEAEKKQPFFSVFNLMTSHQSRSMVWPYEQFQSDVQSRLSAEDKHDPDTAPLPPYYVDTPIVRREWARLYDCVTAMDQEVGKILEQLETDGLADDTIVFFYSDHGSGMPRHKRALLDSGMHVPLLIRFPEKYQHLAPSKPGTTSDGWSASSILVRRFSVWPKPKSQRKCKASISSAKPPNPTSKPSVGANMSSATATASTKFATSPARCATSAGSTSATLCPTSATTNPPPGRPGRHSPRILCLTDEEKMTPAQWQFAGPTAPSRNSTTARKIPSTSPTSQRPKIPFTKRNFSICARSSLTI